MSPPRKKPLVMKVNMLNKKFQSLKKTVRFQNYDGKHLAHHIRQRLKAKISSDIAGSHSTSATKSPVVSTPAKYPCHEMFISSDEIKNRWYDRSDLIRFRKQAIKLVFLQHNDENSVVKTQPLGMGSLYIKRKRHKANAIRHILLAHRIGKNEEYLARLCASLGRWSKEIALRDALLGYFEVYKPSFVGKIPPILSNPPSISIVTVHPAKPDPRRQSQTKEFKC